jgi:uncharacterized membrane protein YdjX (TVP38/TMEM64 family)
MQTNMELPMRRPRAWPGWLRWVALGIVALALVALFTLLPIKQYLQAFLEWTHGLGFWGYLVVILFYIVACVLFIPGSIVTLATGFLFGVVAGSITVSIGATLGASAAFLVGRFLAREAIEKKVAGNPRFAAIDRAVGRQGFKIVLLTRLSPVFPFNLLNYAFGLTRVPFWTYVLASWIGMMPGTVLYVYLGSTAKDLAQIFSGGLQGGGMSQKVIKIVGLLATVLVTIYVTRLARKALHESIPEKEP